MYIIQVFDQYYLKDDGDHVIETYSPIVATGFTTKKEATEYVTEYTEWKDYSKIIKRTKTLVDEFNEWLVTMQRRKIEKIDRSGKHDFDPTIHGKEEVFDFCLNRNDKTTRSFESYKTWPSLIKYFSNLIDVVRVEDDQYYVQCWFRKDDTYPTFEKEMAYLFNRLDVVELTISVLDHHLSEGGDSVAFTINRDLTNISLEGRFVRDTTYKSLKDCFDFLVEERYYE